MLLLLLVTLLAYAVHLLLKKWIEPRRSAGFFVLYVFAHFAGIILLVFGFGMVLNYYRAYFLG
jgi:hypothetical protein